jgi:hypothetical protein
VADLQPEPVAESSGPADQKLLAVDLGLRTGLAVFGRDGRLIRYRSQNFGARNRLKRGAHGVLRDDDGIVRVVLEGGGDLADVWAREAERQGIDARIIQAETWRRDLLLPREQRTGKDAKSHADTLARRVIKWSDAKAPTSLRHDAAEAILVGLWGVLACGWLGELPDELKR